MARPPRPAKSQPADRSGPTRGAFDKLAGLRGQLKEQRVLGRRIERPESAANRVEKSDAEAPGAGEAALFQAAVAGTQPLPRASARAEIEKPRPAPVPRPRIEEPEEHQPETGRRPRSPRTDEELFRFEMEDVLPIEHGNRAEVGVDRRHLARRPASGEDAAPAPHDPFLLLPQDPDAVDPSELFRYAARGASPIDTRNRAEVDAPQPLPRPLKHLEDEQEALRESMEAPMTLEDRLETGEEAAFLRPGLPRRVLTDLRRGRWVLQAQLDLHGCNRDEAREELARFLTASLQQGRRCVRVIHGKGLGSPGKQSILKHLSRGWLAQREEILAFCQAGPHDGGSGALLVLLRAGSSSRP